MTTPHDIDRLLAQANALPFGTARTAACEEAVRAADSINDLDRAFHARLELVSAGFFGGSPDLLLVAFTWLLGMADRHPDRFGTLDNRYQLLWRYKWAVQSLCGYPQFPRAQIEDMLADMRHRFLAGGHSLHRVHDAERRVLTSFGEPAAADAAFDRMTRCRPDDLSENPTCVAEGRVGHLRFMERWAEAAEEAEPFVHRRKNCEGGPVWAAALVLLPLFHLGELKRGMRYHKLGYPLAADNPGYLGAVNHHIEWLTITDNLERAVRLAERHLPALDADARPALALAMYTNLRFLALRLVATRRDVRWSAGPADAAFRRFDEASRELAGRFDARNGNRYYTAEIEEQATHAVTPYPLGRVADD